MDAASENIEAAKAHLGKNPLLQDTERLTYLATTAEELEGEAFDVVVSSEVVEHVVNPPEFIKTLSSLVKPGGLVVISTLNRTIWSYGLAIVAAEQVLGLAPKGAHDWNQFVTPEELSLMCKKAGLELTVAAGMTWNVPKMQFELAAEDLSVNYIAAFSKTKLDAS